MSVIRPVGKILRSIDPRIYTLIRWKMKILMGNPMGQLFLLPYLVHSGDTVIDIGANTGQLTIPLARLVGDNGTVYAFEPITKNYNELKENIIQEDISSIVQLNQLGLSNKPQFATFTIPRNRYTEATLQPHNDEAWKDYYDKSQDYVNEQCEITTIDNFVKKNNIDNISFLKCDVEGGELQVLQGSTSVLTSSKPPIIMLEAYEKWTKDFDYHPRDLFRFLKQEANYDI